MMPGDWVPLMGMLTGAVGLVVIGFIFTRVAQGPIGQAIVRRIQGRNLDQHPELRAEVEGLRENVEQLQQRLTEAEEHTSELQSRQYLVCRLLLEKKKKEDTSEHQ